MSLMSRRNESNPEPIDLHAALAEAEAEEATRMQAFQAADAAFTAARDWRSACDDAANEQTRHVAHLRSQVERADLLAAHPTIAGEISRGEMALDAVTTELGDVERQIMATRSAVEHSSNLVDAITGQSSGPRLSSDYSDLAARHKVLRDQRALIHSAVNRAEDRLRVAGMPPRPLLVKADPFNAAVVSALERAAA